MGAIFWSSLSAIIAAAALAATAWQGHLLHLQVASTDRVARAQFYQQVTMMCIQRDRLFIQYPELWDYFYGNRPGPTDKTARARVLAASRIMANLANVLDSETIPEDFTGHWNQYFLHMYQNSPSFQDFWKEHSQFWPEAVRRRFPDSASGTPPAGKA
jgi:hypothetical protein